MSANTAPWPFLASANPAALSITECAENITTVNKKCTPEDVPPKCSKECAKAQKCILFPYDSCKTNKDTGKPGACCGPETTGHHLVEVHCFSKTGARGSPLEGFEKYDMNKALCTCASTSRFEGSHGIMHGVQGKLESAFASGPSLKSWKGVGRLIKDGGGRRNPAHSHWTFKDAKETGVLAHQAAFPDCNPDCIKKQLEQSHKGMGIDDDTKLRTDPGAGTRNSDDTLKNADPKALAQMNAQVDALKGVGAAPTSL